MIWDILQQSTFCQHFQHEALTITQLLLDENIITELKNQNPQLLQYLHQNKRQFITEMIQYVIIMPNSQDSHDRCYRLPYISSELLALNSDLIYSEFFQPEVKEEDNQYWLQLIGFLDRPESHNQILSGYFQKVINNLYNGNKTKTCRIISLNLHKFIALLQNGSIGDILKHSIILLTIPDGEVEEERFVILQHIVEKLVCSQETTKKICANIIIQIVNKFQTFSSGEKIIQQLFNNKTFYQIYSIESSIAINELLIAIIVKSQQTTVNQHDQVTPILIIPGPHLQFLAEYLKKQVKNLQKYGKSEEYIRNQSKKIVRKSSKEIYSILNLLSLAIESISIEFLSFQLIKILWSLLGLYPFNNILQVIIFKIFVNILKKPNQKIQYLFLNHYESYMLELAEINLEMLRPLLFRLWNQAKNHNTITTDTHILQKFSLFTENNFQNRMKYEVNRNSIMNSERKSNRKLIVDQEDSIKESRTQPQIFSTYTQQTIQIIPYKFRDETFNQTLKEKEESSNVFGAFNFDQFKITAEEQPSNEKSSNIFGAFDSFF